VIYRDRVIHVASWAARFLFASEQLDQPVGKLSGGERARVLIANLMLEPADLLLLDEPTNDLDIPTLEILEESLLEFRGAMVLVSHDRYLLDRVSNVVLGLDGLANAEVFADYSQWEVWQAEQKQSKRAGAAKTQREPSRSETSPSVPKRKLSYLEAREFSTIEQRISEAEEAVRQTRSAAEDPAIMSNAEKLLHAHAELEQSQKILHHLYERWAELEDKQQS